MILSFEEVLAFAASEGYQCVEVMCWPSAKEDRPYGGVCHIDVTNFTQAQADDVRALCEKHGVQISALGYYANALSDDANEAEVARSHFRKVIDAAPLLGSAERQRVHRRQSLQAAGRELRSSSRKSGPISSVTPRTAA